MQELYNAAIFDLDGVIIDTAKYHYLAWKRLAKELGFEFSLMDNEKLKGVSRERSLELLLKTGNFSVEKNEMDRLIKAKNDWYVEYISDIDNKKILPGALECLLKLKAARIKTAIGSASKNTPMIIEKLGIGHLFNAVIDGNCVRKAKPDPECFRQCAERIKVPYSDCVVFEDSNAGIRAAKAARMYAVGIGNSSSLKNADFIISGLNKFFKVQHLFGINY